MSSPKVNHGKPARLAWSISELAAALGTNYDSVSRAIKAGRLEAFKLFGVGEWRVSTFAVAGLLGVDPIEMDTLLAGIAERDASAERRKSA